MNIIESNDDNNIIDNSLLDRAKLLLRTVNLNIDNNNNNNNNDSIVRPVSSNISNQNSNNNTITIKNDNILNSDDYYHVKGSAIKGSSLLTTFSDIRGYCNHGSQIYINGFEYNLRLSGGDWNSNCVELSSDYLGETSYECTISISKNITKSINRLDSRKALPVSSLSIKKAVEELDELIKPIKSSNNSSSKIVNKPKIKSSKNIINESIDKKLDDSLSYSIDININNNINTNINTLTDKLKLNEDKIHEELKKTQERIHEWKRKMELKAQEDELNRQQYKQIKSNKSNKLKKKKKHKEIIPNNEDVNNDSINNNDDNIEINIIDNQNKIELLKQKTNERLLNYKLKKQKEIEKRNNQLLLEEKAKLERLKELQDNNINDKIKHIKQETMKRLINIKNKDKELELMNELDKQKKLNDLAEIRGRQRPTSDWFPDTPLNLPTTTKPLLTTSSNNNNVNDKKSNKQQLKLPDISNKQFNKSEQRKRNNIITDDFNRSKSEQAYRSMNTIDDIIQDTNKLSINSIDSQDDLLSNDSLIKNNNNNQMNSYNSDDDDLFNITTNNQNINDNNSIISDVTIDYDNDYKDIDEKKAINNKMKRKKKNIVPVWKLPPIPIQQYIPVPARSS